jgi:hypothetical protein
MKNNLQVTFRLDEHTGDIISVDIQAPTEADQVLIKSAVKRMLRPHMVDKVRRIIGVIRGA